MSKPVANGAAVRGTAPTASPRSVVVPQPTRKAEPSRAPPTKRPRTDVQASSEKGSPASLLAGARKGETAKADSVELVRVDKC